MTEAVRVSPAVASALARLGMTTDLINHAQPVDPGHNKRLAREILAVTDAWEANAVRAERRRWLNWLADIGYGADFTHDDPPPCSVRELAEVLNKRENLDDHAEGGQTGVDVHVWVIAENTGWETCDNCGGDPITCDCDES